MRVLNVWLLLVPYLFFRGITKFTFRVYIVQLNGDSKFEPPFNCTIYIYIYIYESHSKSPKPHTEKRTKADHFLWQHANNSCNTRKTNSDFSTLKKCGSTVPQQKCSAILAFLVET